MVPAHRWPVLGKWLTNGGGKAEVISSLLKPNLRPCWSWAVTTVWQSGLSSSSSWNIPRCFPTGFPTSATKDLDRLTWKKNHTNDPSRLHSEPCFPLWAPVSSPPQRTQPLIWGPAPPPGYESNCAPRPLVFLTGCWEFPWLSLQVFLPSGFNELIYFSFSLSRF